MTDLLKRLADIYPDARLRDLPGDPKPADMAALIESNEHAIDAMRHMAETLASQNEALREAAAKAPPKERRPESALTPQQLKSLRERAYGTGPKGVTHTMTDAIDLLVEKYGSQVAVAKRVGVSKGYLSRLRLGVKENPSDEVLARMGLVERTRRYKFVRAK